MYGVDVQIYECWVWFWKKLFISGYETALKRGSTYIVQSDSCPNPMFTDCYQQPHSMAADVIQIYQFLGPLLAGL